MLLMQLVWVAIFCALSASGNGSAAAAGNCEKGFLSPSVSQRLFHEAIASVVIKSRPADGFEVTNENWELNRDTSGDVEVLVDSLLFDRSRWRMEEWIYHGVHYSFLDLGFKNFEADAREIHRLVLEHVTNFPNAKLTVNFGLERSEDLRKRMQLRWAVQDEVLNVYKASKAYLGWADLAILKYVNRISSNSDMFTLLRHDSARASWTNLVGDDVNERLVTTAQVSYHGDPIVMVPTTKSLLAMSDDLGNAAPASRKFPFEYRVDLSQSRQIHDNLAIMFDLNTTCEITRFVNKVARLPRPIMHRLLFEVFDSIQKRGMKVILASLDDTTFRFFSREYGFSKVYKFPVKGNTQLETLAFLALDTQLFTETYRRVRKSGDQVEVRRINGQ